MIYDYRKDPKGLDKKIKNAGAIRNPHGRKAQYLQVMEGEGTDLIAVSWHRVKPAPRPLYHLVKFF